MYQGKLHDVKVLDTLLPEPGAFYIMDRAYLDLERLHLLTLASAFFVTRAKSNLKFPVFTPSRSTSRPDYTGDIAN